jgi:type IV secretion system protein TrbH
MRKLSFAAPILAGLAGLAALVGLAGCTTTRSPYGNFARNAPAVHDRTMADDAVKQLMAVYPPARTRFDLQQATPDAFGTLLVAKLRSGGYALLEFKPAPGAQDTNAATGEPSASTSIVAVAPASLAPALALNYVLDLDAGSNLYRVTLLVGNQSLTRAYLAQNESVYPAGSWARKE